MRIHFVFNITEYLLYGMPFFFGILFRLQIFQWAITSFMMIGLFGFCKDNSFVWHFAFSPFAKLSSQLSGSVRHLRNLRLHAKEPFAVCESMFCLREKLSRMAKGSFLSGRRFRGSRIVLRCSVGVFANGEKRSE